MARPKLRRRTAAGRPTTLTLDLTRLLHALIAAVDDAGAKRPRLDELQVDPLVQRRKVGRAAAQDDRAYEEPALVDQPELHAGGRQTRAADSQVLAWLFLQLGDLFGNAVPDQPGIALDLLESLREHDLRQVLPNAGELEDVLRGRWVLVGGLPEHHLLVQPPPAELGAELPRLLIVEPMQLLVRGRPVDLPFGPGDKA